MFWLNKVVGVMTSPAFVGLCLLLAGFVGVWLGRRRWACGLVGAALVWLGVWMSPATYRWLATAREREFPVRTVEELPSADAIRILGGGVGASTNVYPYSEMWMSADRVWHGARLYRAGKAPRVFVTNASEIPLLIDFGVPKEAITLCTKARNTEEEARFLVQTLNAKSKVLLVTSAWHMRRALLMFRRYAPELEVIPAATDYEALVRCEGRGGLSWRDLLPDAEMFYLNSYMFKENIGYWGYRLLRRN